MTTQPRKGLIYQRVVSGKRMYECAQLIGVTPSHYSKIERGVSGLSFERAAQLAEFFECRLEDLL